MIAPLARGPLNVNADEAAWALAVGLGAERLLFHTDVPGVFAEGALLPSIEVDEADRMLEDGSFEGGIVPKLHAAVRPSARGSTRDRRNGCVAVSRVAAWPVLPTYARFDITFVKGDGARLVADDGSTYLDSPRASPWSVSATCIPT